MYGREELTAYDCNEGSYDSMGFPWEYKEMVYAKDKADKVMDAMEARIKELESIPHTDNTSVIDALQKRVKELQAENAKLKCLALHAMSEWLSALLWLAGTYLGKCLEPHIDVNLCTALRRKYNDAYRKTKKALMEGKC